jgi:hypothetical protein
MFNMDDSNDNGIPDIFENEVEEVAESPAESNPVGKQADTVQVSDE